jgi:hypothetical protein
MFSENDLTQFQEKGITAFAAEQQLYFFRNGFPYPDIVSPATAERGISIFDENQIQELINEFDSFEGEISKFVPASGAATRMLNCTTATNMYSARRVSRSSAAPTAARPGRASRRSSAATIILAHIMRVL